MNNLNWMQHTKTSTIGKNRNMQQHEYKHISLFMKTAYVYTLLFSLQRFFFFKLADTVTDCSWSFTDCAAKFLFAFLFCFRLIFLRCFRPAGLDVVAEVLLSALFWLDKRLRFLLLLRCLWAAKWSVPMVTGCWSTKKTVHCSFKWDEAHYISSSQSYEASPAIWDDTVTLLVVTNTGKFVVP